MQTHPIFSKLIVLPLLSVLLPALAEDHGFKDLNPTQGDTHIFPVTSPVKREPPQIELPRLLTKDFYKVEDVCRDARKNSPGKKLAIVLLKTDYCDIDTQVCLKALRTVSDPANEYVHRNFALYHTSFISYEIKGKELIQSCAEGTCAIRDEWNKRDLNPEMLVVDIATCKILGRKYFKSHTNSFADDFSSRYLACRDTLLTIPGVSAATGVRPKHTITFKEDQWIKDARKKSPERTILEMNNAQINQILQNNVHYTEQGRMPYEPGRYAVKPMTKCQGCSKEPFPKTKSPEKDTPEAK